MPGHLDLVHPAPLGPGEKRGRLHGGAATEEALSSSRSVLSPNRGSRASFVGLQQYFTPPEAAGLIARVLGGATAVFDPTAGSGSLLAPLPEAARFGIEIDRDQMDGSYRAINGDAQTVVPMLRAAGVSFPAVVANPPFGHRWRDPVHAKGEINSTALAYLWALDLLDDHGQGALVAGRERLGREVLRRPEGAGVYAIVDVEGPLFDGIALPVSIAFFVRPPNRRPGGPVERLKAAREGLALEETSNALLRARRRLTRHVSTWSPDGRKLRQGFSAVAREHARRAEEASRRAEQAPVRSDVGLKGKNLSVHLSAFSKLALAKAGILRDIETLGGQNLSYFGQNPRAWAGVERARDGGLLTIAPGLAEKTRAIVANAAKLATPLFPVKEQMRLGWLADLATIRCAKADPEKGYEAGREYALSTRSKVKTERSKRVVENKSGEPELRQFETERRLLEVRIGQHAFDEGNDAISYIIEHFELPDPGCVATRHPEDVAKNRRILDEIEVEVRANYDRYMRAHGQEVFEPFSYKEFQKDHLSRLLVKRRGMLAHEQGLGKTLMLMTIARAEEELGAAPQVLIVAPQDILPQWQREAEKFFGRGFEEIRTPAQARDAARRVAAGEPGWWITYFEALSVVGRKKEVLPEAPLSPLDALHERLSEHKHKKMLAARRDSGPAEPPAAAARGDEPKDAPDGALPAASPGGARRKKRTTTLHACPRCGVGTSGGWDGEVCRAPKRCRAHEGCAETGPGHAAKACGYVHRRLYVKSAYAHLTNAFKRGVKCVDELSEIRGDESLRSKSVRALARGPHNYGATGTPLSNFIADSFWGLWFALGNASEAFPYAYNGGKAKFEADFCVIEHMMGRQEKGEGHLKVRRKVLPQVTNVSQFWRLTQPGISRCRKEGTGERLVKRTYHPIRVPMGRSQRAAHAFWLKHFPDYFAWKFPDHPLVAENLVEKWAAALGQLWRLESAATLPAGDGPSREWPRARQALGELSNWTPATLKVLELAMEHASRGEKVLVGSDLILTGKWLADRLREKGVRSVHITEERGTGAEKKVGTKNPRKRAREVEAFVEGDAQVMCAGVGAMKLGHNLQVASTVIVHGLPYSYMSLDQFIARVHRLTSPREVSVYVVVPRGSLAENKWSLLKDKGGASDLAFDGELSVQPEEAVNWSQVLRDMKRRGIPAAGDEVLEADIEAAWRDLVPRIRATPERSPSETGEPWPPDEGKNTSSPGTRPGADAPREGIFDTLALLSTDDEGAPRLQPALF